MEAELLPLPGGVGAGDSGVWSGRYGWGTQVGLAVVGPDKQRLCAMLAGTELPSVARRDSQLALRSERRAHLLACVVHFEPQLFLPRPKRKKRGKKWEKQKIKTTKALRDATPVIAISIERVDSEGKKIDKDANIDSRYIKMPFFAEGLEVRYELASALLRTSGQHYVSLLRNFETDDFYRVSDNHEPTEPGVQEIRKAEIFLFIRV